MTLVQFRWHNYKYFPYERSLAHRELEELIGVRPVERQECLAAEVATEWRETASRLTYFSEVFSLSAGHVIPNQAMLEASANGRPAMRRTAPKLNRQMTRYSAHGIHEYRGKFNPQIVRAIGNILKLQHGCWILDPFCGSGTTLLESLHNGWNAIGVDLNPLAIEITRAKIESMRMPAKTLERHTMQVCRDLAKKIGGVSFITKLSRSEIVRIAGPDWESCLHNIEYLKSWFAESVLVQIAAILDEISRVPHTGARLIFHVMLSDILRDASLQNPDDLRMRRRKKPSPNAPAIKAFIDSVAEKVDRILAARSLLPKTTTNQFAILGDCRLMRNAIVSHPHLEEDLRFDAVITSPPYATALPYIDTQRLSLTLLDMVKPRDLRESERALIGGREILLQTRLELERSMRRNSAGLPQDCVEQCLAFLDAFDDTTDGFRRRNKPALLYKYFSDMASMFTEARQVLKEGAHFALVIGQNFTRLGGRKFAIDTPNLLKSIAEAHSFVLRDEVKLNTYQRYHIHKSNSVRSERLIIMEAA